MKQNRHRPTNVALYARSATGDGLDTQLACLASMIKDRQRQGEKWIVTHTFVDFQKGGGDTDRPAYQQLLKLVRSGKISVVVVERLDRLSRVLDDFAKVLGELDRRGVRLVSLRERIDVPLALRLLGVVKKRRIA